MDNRRNRTIQKMNTNKLQFQWYEFKRTLKNVYSWNRTENKYTYYCSCSNYWYRSGKTPVTECKFCHQPITTIRKCSVLQALKRAFKVALPELNLKYIWKKKTVK